MEKTPRVVTIQENSYRIGRLNAITQFHVARRLAPVIVAMTTTLKDKESNPELDFFDLFAKSNMANVLAEMKDTEIEYVIFTCLAVCQRQQKVGHAESWAPVLSRSKELMFQDIEMSEMLELTVNVIQENLENFFTTAQQASNQL